MDYIIEYKAINNPDMPVARTTFTTCKKFDVCRAARCFEKSRDNRVFVTDCKEK